MTSKLTRERIEWLNYAATGLAANGTEMAMSPQDVIALTEYCLTTIDSEPVAVVEPSDYVTAAQLVGEGPARKAVHELYEGALRIGDKLYRHAQPASVVVPDGLRLALSNAGIAAPESDEMLAATCEKQIQALVTWVRDRRPFQPAPVVPDERAAFNAWNNEDNLPIAGVGAKNAAWLAWQARASLCGNSVLDVPPERPADSSSGNDVEAWFDEGWNACRAAMLNGGKS